MARRPWSRPEQVQALELYLRTPFGRIHNRNQEIINLAFQLGRTANALALKMANFAALDPTISQKGMSNFSKSDAEMWEEFYATPSSFIEKISLVSQQNLAEQSYEYPDTPSHHQPLEFREGEDIERVVKTRKNQNFFRKMLIASYEGHCAATEIAQLELLVASHIKPWSEDKEARLDPRNGILLNVLHDRAFDAGLITFEDDLTLVPSKQLNIPEMAWSFFYDKKLKRPVRFAPHASYLEYHRTEIFKDSPKVS